VVENRPLAQALWREVEIGDAIPEKFYEVVSVVLAQVYRMSGRVPGAATGDDDRAAVAGAAG
jgi:flagellar biosynthesis protein FlhB